MVVLLRIPAKLSTLVAFADDLAAFLLQLHHGLRVLYPLFLTLQKATGLVTNPKKTVIIPLGFASPFTVKRFVHESLPQWAKFKVDDCGKLLWVWICPGSVERRWKDVMDKFTIRANDSKATHFAIEATMRHYRVHSFPVLSHLCQFCAAPAETLAAESAAPQELTRGPHRVFPRGSAAALRNLGLRFEATSSSHRQNRRRRRSGQGELRPTRKSAAIAACIPERSRRWDC
jgi:hypothetical protein